MRISDWSSDVCSSDLFTFVDLGPRLITVTHHDAIAGPYHRNGDAILDVQHGFGGSPEQFRAIAKRHHATLLMVCPNMPESTVYRAPSPGGFYDQLAHGKRFDWPEPVAVPAKSPTRVGWESGRAGRSMSVRCYVSWWRVC